MAGRRRGLSRQRGALSRFLAEPGGSGPGSGWLGDQGQEEQDRGRSGDGTEGGVARDTGRAPRGADRTPGASLACVTHSRPPGSSLRHCQPPRPCSGRGVRRDCPGGGVWPPRFRARPRRGRLVCCPGSPPEDGSPWGCRDGIRQDRPSRSPCRLSPRPRAEPCWGLTPAQMPQSPAPPRPRGRPRADPVQSPGAGPCRGARLWPESAPSARTAPCLCAHPLLGRYTHSWAVSGGLCQAAGLVCQSGGRTGGPRVRPGPAGCGLAQLGKPAPGAGGGWADRSSGVAVLGTPCWWRSAVSLGPPPPGEAGGRSVGVSAGDRRSVGQAKSPLVTVVAADSAPEPDRE